MFLYLVGLASTQNSVYFKTAMILSAHLLFKMHFQTSFNGQPCSDLDGD